MREEIISGHEVRLWDDPEKLPIVRFQKRNEIDLDDAGIGSDIPAYHAHLQKILIFNEKGDKLAVKQEIMNMSQNVEYIRNGTNLSAMAMGIMIESVDGVPQTKWDDLSIKKLMISLNPQQNLVLLIADEVKKKLILFWKSILKT